MCSIPRLPWVAIGLVFLVGCNSTPMPSAKSEYHNLHEEYLATQRPSQREYAAMQPDPPADVASAVRPWAADTYWYPNGATLAYPTYHLNVEDRRGMWRNDYYYSFALPFLIWVDTITMPAKMVIETPNQAVVYHGVRQPPTMTAGPPLPSQ